MHLDQIRRGDIRRRLLRDLVGSGHVGVEDFHRDGNKSGMRDPSTVVARANFPQLVLANFVESLGIRDWIAFDGNLRRHPAHCMNAAAMAGVDEQPYVSFQERAVHGDLRAIRQNETGMVAQFFNEREDVIPAATV